MFRYFDIGIFKFARYQAKLSSYHTSLVMVSKKTMRWISVWPPDADEVILIFGEMQLCAIKCIIFFVCWFDMIIVFSDTWCAFLRIYCRCNLLHCGSYERYIHKYTYICSCRSFMKEAVHINAIFHLFFWPSDLMQSSLHRMVQRVLSTFILHHFIKLMFLNVLQLVMSWLIFSNIIRTSFI